MRPRHQYFFLKVFLKLLQYATKFENLCYRALLLQVWSSDQQLCITWVQWDLRPHLRFTESEAAFQQYLQMVHKHMKVQEALPQRTLAINNLHWWIWESFTFGGEIAFPASLAARPGHVTYTTPMKCTCSEFWVGD